MENLNKVLILDFGSQYTQLIARRIREAGVYSEIHPCNIDIEKLKKINPSAIVFSGGPASVCDKDAPDVDTQIFNFNVPILGICYGMQLIAKKMGGKVTPSTNREYGRANLIKVNDSLLFRDVFENGSLSVWMSHGDKVDTLPPGFITIAKTENIDVAAMENREKKIYCLQFHPEVVHTQNGEKILRNFLFDIAKLKPTWNMASFVKNLIDEVPKVVGDANVVCGISGGIDSTVVSVLLNKAIGKKLHCIFVDNGLLRQNEGKEVVHYLTEHFDLNLRYVDASKLFLTRLKGVVDPEEKRKIIGRTFIEVFENEARKIENVKFLAQGTLYPDVIESVSYRGPSAVIKSHHNVGGLPEKMNLELIEPLRELFKDEVRKVAYELGIPDFLVWRHPFPGPGLAIRIIGEITDERLKILRQADKIVEEELKDSGWYYKVWQGFAVLLPLKTVGVMGDERTYEHVVALRIVDSLDAMTADWSRLPSELLARISNRIINEVKGVNRVVFDISSKPPSTIEWE